MTRSLFFMAAPLALAACITEPAARGAACTDGAYDGLVGANIATVTLPAELDQRIVREGEVVTMEFKADRLTIITDEAGIVTRAYCG